MQEVKSALNNIQAANPSLDTSTHNFSIEEKALFVAAESWAVYCLRTHNGKALRKGLRISSAITGYLDAIHEND